MKKIVLGLTWLLWATVGQAQSLAELDSLESLITPLLSTPTEALALLDQWEVEGSLAPLPCEKSYLNRWRAFAYWLHSATRDSAGWYLSTALAQAGDHPTCNVRAYTTQLQLLYGAPLDSVYTVFRRGLRWFGPTVPAHDKLTLYNQAVIRALFLDMDSALVWNQRAQPYLPTQPDVRSVRWHLNQGHIFYSKEAIDKALPYMQTAYAQAQTIQDTVGLLEAMSFQVDYYRDTQELDSLYYLAKQMDTLLRRYSRAHLAVTVTHCATMSNAFRKLGDWAKAKTFADRGVLLLDGNPDFSTSKMNLYNALIGYHQHESKQLDSALYWAWQTKALSLPEEVKAYQLYPEMVAIYEAQQRPDSIYHYLHKIEAALNNEMTIFEPATLYRLARGYLALAAHQKGLDWGRKAWAAYLAAPDRNYRKKKGVAKVLSACFAGLGQYDSAYAYQTQEMQYHDSLNVQETKARLAELQTQYETAEKEQQIAGLQTRQTLQARNLRNLGAGAGLVLLALLALAWQYRKQQRTKQALAQANDTKDRLFSVLAHDVRSPINNLLSVTQLLELDAINAEERTRMLAEARQRGEQVLAMLDNLLHWTRHQMEALQVQPTALNLPAAVAEVAAIYCPQAREKDITLHYRIPEGTQVQADPEVLRLVLRNLISNSLKFTPAGGEIRISVGPEGPDRCSLVVQDTGQGMDAATVQRLLVSREQHSTRGLRGEKGTGLGLRLVQDFLGHLGSQLRIESQPGQGTTFTFALPKVP